MSKIERVEKQVETKEVETSETITVYACDVCGHEYDDESELNELHKNPSVQGKYVSLKELDKVIDCAHYKQGLRELKDSSIPSMGAGIKRGLIDCVSREIRALPPAHRDFTKHRPLSARFGTNNYYKDGGMVELFTYHVRIEPTSDARYDVCDDCYSVVFDGA